MQKHLLGGTIDILMLQDHHLFARWIGRYGTILTRGWDMFWVAAIGPHETRGGICMAIVEKWKSSMLEKPVVGPRRAQLVVI